MNSTYLEYLFYEGVNIIMKEALMELSFDELMEKFESNMKMNKYRHDIAVLFGSLGISPTKYSSFMNTLDEIEIYKKLDRQTERL
jgi:hypothetical protein